MPLSDAFTQPAKGVVDDVKDIAKNPEKIMVAPALLPFNFLKRSVAAAFNIGKGGSEKAFDVMTDLAVRSTINTARYGFHTAIAAACAIPLPVPGGSIYGAQQELASKFTPEGIRMRAHRRYIERKAAREEGDSSE